MSLNWSARALKLVAGLDRDALAKIARADAGGAAPQRLDRHHHPAGEKEARDQGEQQTGEQQQDRALDRGVERRISFLDWQFDEHEPAERRDRCISGQHAPAANVLGFLDLVGRRCLHVRARSLDLREVREVGVAQHEADVRMRDQPPLPVDDIGLTTLADLDLGDNVPDQLEIDLGDGDAGIAPRAGERQRHVGFQLAPEIDRAVIDLVGDGLGEFRVFRVIDLAADNVHGEPRHPQLLVAGGIELGSSVIAGTWRRSRTPSKRRCIERAGRPGQLSGPADLRLDLPNELADFGRCRFGLFALDADQRRFVLLIRELDLENAVGDEGDEDDRKYQHDIFEE